MLLAMPLNVLLSLLILFNKLIPSIMHADGYGICSADATLPSVCRARVNLFVFLRVPSQLDNALGKGLKDAPKLPSNPDCDL